MLCSEHPVVGGYTSLLAKQFRKEQMSKYKAIWQIDLDLDAEALLKEFSGCFPHKLSKVYSENESWTGVTVWKKGDRFDLQKLPEVGKLIESLGKNNVVGINYFNLETNSKLHEHRDMNGNLLFGIVRIHIPLITNGQAFMFVERIKYHLPVGTAWVLDTSGLHALANGPVGDRIHLVIDIKKGAETRQYFPKWSCSVVLHLSKFILIMLIKIVRDILSNPGSLVKRLKDKIKEYKK